MARGSRYLAAFWSEAWRVGGGDGAIGDGARRDPDDLMKLYNDPGFAPSIPLNKY
ncbi:MAG TPA: hypothetical protein VG939_01680 [Caulobacteraceae bacterium]|nr:hypothetical protein [Caulobacteraceae bacterium]